MDDTKTLLEELLKWRILFWSSVGLMTIIPFCMYYFDEKIGNLKTQISLNKINEEKILSLIDDLVKHPTNYDDIYKQIEYINVPSSLYPKFRAVVPIINQFCLNNLKNDFLNSQNFEDLHNRTIPLLLDKFPHQVYDDKSLDYEFNNRSQLYYIKTHRRKYLIQVLHKVVINSSIESHKYAIRGMIYDLFWYNPELLDEFKNTFGETKIKEIRDSNLWTGIDLKNLADECREGLIKFGVINPILLEH